MMALTGLVMVMFYCLAFIRIRTICLGSAFILHTWVFFYNLITLLTDMVIRPFNLFIPIYSLVNINWLYPFFCALQISAELNDINI